MTEYEAHPAAAVWPMLPEPDLRRLADDIATNGLRHPIVLDTEGRVLDGRNRLAACRIAGVDPEFISYEGDPVSLVLSENNERRHLSLPERAAATALTLATEGQRENGKWKYGTVSATAPERSESGASGWTQRMAEAGVVLDHAAELLPKVAAGNMALDAAVQQANKIRDEKKRRAELPDDLGVLVDSGELTIPIALRRAKLSSRYGALVASGDLNLDEAEHLNQRDDREHREAIQRYVNGLMSFLNGWNTAAHLADDPHRDEVLSELSEYDRDRFERIEKETTWPSTQI
jgi:hypothetical protein